MMSDFNGNIVATPKRYQSTKMILMLLLANKIICSWSLPSVPIPHRFAGKTLGHPYHVKLPPSNERYVEPSHFYFSLINYFGQHDYTQEIIPPPGIKHKPGNIIPKEKPFILKIPSMMNNGTYQPLNPAVVKYLEAVKYYIHTTCKVNKRIKPAIPLALPYDFKAHARFMPLPYDFNVHTHRLTKADNNAIKWANIKLQLHCDNRFINPAVTEYWHQIRQYINLHCAKGKRKNFSISLPTWSNFKPQYQTLTLRKRDRDIIEWIDLEIQFHCNNKLIVPEVMEYWNKITTYIDSNCNKGQRINSTIPLPKPFNFTAHTNTLYGINNDTINHISRDLQWQCNRQPPRANTTIILLGPVVVQYDQDIGSYIDANYHICKLQQSTGNDTEAVLQVNRAN